MTSFSPQLFSVARLGIKSLLLHKLRTALAMMGIIFGVCSVIAMLAIGEGASYEAQEAIKKLGRDNIILHSLKPTEETKLSGMSGAFSLDYGLTYADGVRIQSTIPGVRRVLPVRSVLENVRFAQNSIPCEVRGTLPAYAEVAGIDILRGRFLTETDERNQANVTVLSAALARRLFAYQDPLEQCIRVDAFYYRVVGLIRDKYRREHRAQAGKLEGEPIDNVVYLPLSTARTRFGEVLVRRSAGREEREKVALHEMTVQMRDTAFVERADPQIKTLLNRFHSKNDYKMVVPLQLLQQAEQTKRIFNIVLGSIAAISLLVGGIGIMNIMLATVTERTREIGIRRALGARKRHITLQFLVESVMLAIGGGVIGVTIGILVPLAVTNLAGMKTIVTWWSVVAAFGISAAVGIVFGLYPAKAAAELDPIEALRHE